MRDKIKRFYNDHAEEIIISVTVGTAFVIGYVSGYKDSKDRYMLTGANLYKNNENDKTGYLVTNTKRAINTYEFQFND